MFLVTKPNVTQMERDFLENCGTRNTSTTNVFDMRQATHITEVEVEGYSIQRKFKNIAKEWTNHLHGNTIFFSNIAATSPAVYPPTIRNCKQYENCFCV